MSTEPRRNMEREDFEVVAKIVYEAELEFFQTHKYVNCTLIGFDLTEDHRPKGIAPLNVTPFFNEKLGVQGKNVVAGIFDMAIQANAFDICVLISEAWTVTLKDEGSVLSITPSQHPNKKEAVMVMLRTRDFKIGVIYPIDRENNTLIYQPLDWEKTDWTGRFTGQENTTH